MLQESEKGTEPSRNSEVSHCGVADLVFQVRQQQPNLRETPLEEQLFRVRAVRRVEDVFWGGFRGFRGLGGFERV